MVLTVVRNKPSRATAGPRARMASNASEIVAFCPGCKTMETLGLSDGFMIPTRKFVQRGTQVFHDCGTQEPCRLYRPR